MKQIIALGGGGFSMEPENLSLDRYILEQAGVARPRVCFIGTASGDSERYLAGFYACFARLDARPSHLPLFQRTPDLKSLLLEQEVVYVGGGNTKSMLATWHGWGLPEILREAWQKGVILAGVSAGAACWFEQCLTDSYAGPLRVLEGLGFLKGSFVPHYDGEKQRRPMFHSALLEGKIMPGLAADDGAAVHFRENDIYKVVASGAQSRLYRVEIQGAEILETPLQPRLLA